MSRRLVAVNVLLVAISLVSIGYIVKHLATRSAASASRSKPPATTATPAPAPEEPRLPAQAYNVVASRNLFNPTRTEASVAAAPGSGPVVNIVKPNLHGVVLRDGSPVAYLEDPMTKRIAGYRIGDAIAGGTVQTISADAVVIARPDGIVDVRLRDPGKPRPQPPATPPQPTVPGQQPVPGAATHPGVVPGPQPVPGAIPPRAFVPPPTEGQPGVQPNPAFPNLPFGRPSPSLGRRLPPPPAEAPAPQQQN